VILHLEMLSCSFAIPSTLAGTRTVTRSNESRKYSINESSDNLYPLYRNALRGSLYKNEVMVKGWPACCFSHTKCMYSPRLEIFGGRSLDLRGTFV
jgi:hypothetical protein